MVSIRHTLATLAYRLRKPISGAPAGFASTTAGTGTRSAVEILTHIGDVLDWALTMVQGREAWRPAAPLPWPEEVARVQKSLVALDAAVGSGDEMKIPAAILFQSAIADALWHSGQLALLRRIAGAPVEGENYAVAAIEEGSLAIS